MDFLLELTSTQVFLFGYMLLVWLLDQKGGATSSGAPFSFKEEGAYIA